MKQILQHVYPRIKHHTQPPKNFMTASAVVDDITHIKNTPLAKTAVALTTNPKKKKSEETIGDPRSWILNVGENNGDGRSRPKKSFYSQQDHLPKSVGNGNNTTTDDGDTICTSNEMKVLPKKCYLSYYKLTHQTCSGKSENCIFVTGEYSD